MTHYLNHNVLITTQGWFIAPDGKQYRAAWGKLIAIHEASKNLGFIPNRAHANWFVEVGNMVIMGCQVLYVTLCPEKPNTDKVEDYTNAPSYAEYLRPTMIYNANV